MAEVSVVSSRHGKTRPLSADMAFIEKRAIGDVCAWAKSGYETVKKAEVIGFLFGSISQSGSVHIKAARGYDGGQRTRTSVVVDSEAACRRRRALQRKLGIEFLGSFHSHVEIGGHHSCSLSPEDRREFLGDYEARVELLVAVWATCNPGLPKPLRRTISGYDPGSRYAYRVKAYVKAGGRAIRQISIEAV